MSAAARGGEWCEQPLKVAEMFQVARLERPFLRAVFAWRRHYAVQAHTSNASIVPLPLYQVNAM